MPISPKRPLRIAWMPQYTYKSNGYGFISGRLWKALEDAGAELVSRWDAEWDVRVSIGLPSTFPLGRGNPADLVLHTMFEAEPLPVAWSAILNRYAAIWTPSQHSAALFRNSGVTVPIIKAGYGVDRQFFYPDPKRDFTNLNRPLRFGVWTHAFGDRKNAIMAVRAFIDANVSDAELEIKVTWPRDIPKITINGRPAPHIKVHRGVWDRERLETWVRSIDVLIYLSGGEGFGLQPLEFLSTGGGLICADNTGMREYVSNDNAILIPCPTRKPIESFARRYGGEYTVAVPDYAAVVNAIRHISQQRDTLLPMLSQQAIATANLWTWERSARLAVDQLSTQFLK